MEFIAGALIALIGLAICFRGIYLIKVFKAIIGAIQGAVYALLTSIILSLLRIGEGNMLWMLYLVLAALMAYLAAMKEKAYQKIQGFINAFITGAILAAIVYTVIKLQSYANSFYDDAPSLDGAAIFAALAIVITFSILGIKAYRFFRKLGTILLGVLVCTLILIMSMSITPAIIVSIIVVAFFAYLIHFFQQHIECLKISAIGATICVSGVLVMLGKGHLITAIPEMLLDNIGRVIWGYSAYTYYGMEAAQILGGIFALTCVGTVSQARYIASHTLPEEDGTFDWSEVRTSLDNSIENLKAAIAERIDRCAESLSEHKSSILKGLKILVIIAVTCGIIAGGISGGRALISYLAQRREASTIANAASRYVKAVNQAYGEDQVSVAEANPIDEEEIGDGSDLDSVFYADISGTMHGDIAVYGISDPDSGTVYPQYLRVEIDAGDDSVDRMARMFASAISAAFDVNSSDCESTILGVMLYGDFSDASYNWQEVDFGGRYNLNASIYTIYSGETWVLSCNLIF